MSTTVIIGLAVVAAVAFMWGLMRISLWLTDRKKANPGRRSAEGAAGIVAGGTYGVGGPDCGDSGGGGD